MKNPEWYERLVEENSELVTRLTKLRAFLQTEQFKNLPDPVKYAMTSQAICMGSLNSILETRLALGHSF